MKEHLEPWQMVLPAIHFNELFLTNDSDELFGNSFCANNYSLNVHLKLEASWQAT
jgi:hypothetical protein